MPVHPSITTNLGFAIEADQSSLWQDTAATTAASATDPLGNIDDQSANDYDAIQGTTAFKPTVQSGYIALDGVNDGLYQTNIGTYVNSGASFSYWIVLDDTYVSNDIVFLFSDNTTSNRIQFYHRDDGATQRYRLWVQSSSGSSFTYSTNAFSSGIKVINLIHDGSNYYVYINNTLEITASALATDPTITRLDIGSNAAVFGANAQFNFYASYLYDTAHSSGDRTTIYDDLVASYIASDQSVNLSNITLDAVLSNVSVSNDTAQSKTLDSITLDFNLSDSTSNNDTEQSQTLSGIDYDVVLSDVEVTNDAPQSITLTSITLDFVLSDSTPSTAEQNRVLGGIGADYVLSDVIVNNDTEQSKTLTPVILEFAVSDTLQALDTEQSKILGAITLDYVLSNANGANEGDAVKNVSDASVVITYASVASSVITYESGASAVVEPE